MKVTVVVANSPERQALLRQAAHPDMDLTFVPDNASDEEKLSACKGADAIILGSPAANLSTDMLKECSNVRLVQGILAGYDRIDVRGMSALGIPYANNGGGNAVPVAEHALALMLALARGIVPQANNAKSRCWSQGLRGGSWELSNKRYGIVGLGPIGRAMARLLRGFGGDIVYYKRTQAAPEVEAELGVRLVSLDEMMSTADAISVHLSLNESSRGLIGAREIGLMKPTAILVNTSRGAVLDEQALYEALRDGKIAGAGLDVLTREPAAADNPLLELDNVIVTPHQSGISRESTPRSARFAFDNVARAIAGEPIQSVVAP
jgi:phosphoglycerate dehydrogenase-like enzyme